MDTPQDNEPREPQSTVRRYADLSPHELAGALHDATGKHETFDWEALEDEIGIRTLTFVGDTTKQVRLIRDALFGGRLDKDDHANFKDILQVLVEDDVLRAQHHSHLFSKGLQAEQFLADRLQVDT